MSAIFLAFSLFFESMCPLSFINTGTLFTSDFTLLKKKKRQGQCLAQVCNADQESHLVIVLGLPLAEASFFFF
jgi:hypothetical protein